MSDNSSSHGSPWLNQDGTLVHPSAPRGAGGAGQFNIPGSLGQKGNDADPVRHPVSPSGQQQTLTELEKIELADALGVKVVEPKRNPPPKTIAEKFRVKRTGKPRVDFEVQVKKDSKKAAGDPYITVTKMDPKGIKILTPQPFTDAKPGQKEPKDSDKVTSVEGEYAIKGVVTLQVLYGASAKATSPAAWGRGTTKPDRRAKNTTVGFHESHHLADFKNGLKTMTFPAFKGHVGMTFKQYDEAIDQCSLDVDNAFEKLKVITREKTDEVGMTMSEYVKKHPGSKGH